MPPVSGSYPFQRGPGQVDQKTLRITLADDTVIPLARGAATSDNQLTEIDLLAQILDGVHHISIDAESVNLNTDDLEENIGYTDEPMATDANAASGLNGLLRLLISLQGELNADDVLKVDGSDYAQPISADELPLPTGAATEAKQDSQVALQTSANQISGYIVDGVGAIDDTPAPEDDSDASLIALIKRLLSKVPSLVDGETPVTFDYSDEAPTLVNQEAGLGKLDEIAENTSKEPRNTSTVIMETHEDQINATDANDVLPLHGAELLVQTVLVAGRKSPREDNVGTAWVGFSDVAGSQRMKLEYGQELELTANPGEKIDLNKVYIQFETAEDGASITAFI